MVEGENRQSGASPKTTNKQDLVLYRLDAIDKKLIDLQVIVTQTALQEQRIAHLECTIKEQSQRIDDYGLLKERINSLTERRRTTDSRWWQIGIIAVSPIISAIVAFIMAGGARLSG